MRRCEECGVGLVNRVVLKRVFCNECNCWSSFGDCTCGGGQKRAYAVSDDKYVIRCTRCKEVYGHGPLKLTPRRKRTT